MSVTLDDVLALSNRELHQRLEQGHPIDPSALDDTEFHGVALNLPVVAQKIAWLTFKKVFRREGDVLRGWNVAVEQHGVGGPWVDREKRGARVTYGHYQVRAAAGYRAPGAYDHALMIDYGLGEAGLLNVQRLVRDPLVALNEGSPDLLLGYSYVDLGVLQLKTPTWFVLQRGGPLAYDVPAPRG